MTGQARPWTIAGKTCLVTGATSGIGQAIVEELARRGARVLAVARDATRGETVAASIRRSNPDAQVEVLPCELSRMAEVRELARTVSDSYRGLDVLINNAATAMFTRTVTPDGFETSFAVNHLAPFLLTNSLLGALGVPDEARVITVTSDNHKQVKSVPWDDLQGEHSFKPLQAYNRTKLMNVWFTRVLADKVADTGVTANCLSPGFVRTGLARNARGPFKMFIRLVRPFQSSPQQGATTAVYLATSPEVSKINGAYFSKCKVDNPGVFAQDDESARRLWALSAELCGLPARNSGDDRE
jgi:NAD(P)-dependent dehydrogenase (short-subunit alcohol dehydrogenase family)